LSSPLLWVRHIGIIATKTLFFVTTAVAWTNDLVTTFTTTGYGRQSMPGIPGNSTLLFEVELVEVK
jgi:hypothetical protein